MTPVSYHLHLVSDATGETINSIARACLVQFEDITVQEHYWSLIRTKRQLDMVFEGLQQWPGLVLYTFVDDELRRELMYFCHRRGMPSLSVLEPVLTAMTNVFGVPSARKPGRQHTLDAEYFARIDAVNFALAQDDGNRIDHIDEADVIVLGVSRTSKTPTCVYLAHRGVRAANIPIIPGAPLMTDLTQFEKPLIVGLTKDPDNLVEIRRSRMHLIQEGEGGAYIDPEKVREEVQEARRLYTRIGCPILDVTRRSVEETAAEIIMLLNKHMLEREKRQQAESTTAKENR
jgi:hypothetical protein